MTAKDTVKARDDGPPTKQLVRLNASLRASAIAKTAARLVPTRAAVTYGTIGDERSVDSRITSTP